ncbi:hypothetical protein ABKN59_009217 [Abortiporus biennis]
MQMEVEVHEDSYIISSNLPVARKIVKLPLTTLHCRFDGLKSRVTAIRLFMRKGLEGRTRGWSASVD